MTRIPLLGGAYQARSVVAAAQRQLNLLSEPVPQHSTEPEPVTLYPTPGLRRLATLPAAPIRGIREASNGALYVVAGPGVYLINPDWTWQTIGSITQGKTTPVSMMDNGLDLAIVDGSSTGWHVTLADNSFHFITDPNNGFRGADRVDYVDTFFVFNVPGTPQMQVSGSLALTFDPLDFVNKQAVPDMLQTLAVAKREIWLLGSRTTEIFYDSGGTAGSGFPFEAWPNVLIPHGIAAKYSLAEADNALYWLSQTRQGQGIVIEGSGTQATRISTYAMEAEIATYTRIDDAIGMTYQVGGHLFYQLTFPHIDKTWTYDVTTKLWHELAWLDSNGTEHRHRANCATATRGMVVVGDWQSGNLYHLDPATYTDDGQPIKRQRTYPHLLADGKRVFYRQFLADIETGDAGGDVAILGTPTVLMRQDGTPLLREDGTPFYREPDPIAWESPGISLRWSDDRGHSYGSPVLQSLGATGEYLTSVQWQRLGMARDRVWELSWSLPIAAALQGAWLDSTPAHS